MINTIIGIILLFIPKLIGLSDTIQMLGIFIGAIYLWLTKPIEVGSILTLTALSLLSEVTPAQVWSNSFGNSTIMFLILSMVLCYALSSTGVLRKIAIYFIDNKYAKKNVKTFIMMYFLSILILGSFIAPTTVFILFFGLVKEIYSLIGLEQGDELAKRMMVGTGFFASISCAWTPIAHTFPLMALGFYEASTGTAISYAQYMKYSLIIGAILSGIAYLLLTYKMPTNYDFSNVNFEKTPWTKNEIIATVVFGFVTLEWIVVGIMPKTFVYLNKLGTSFPALIGCSILAALGILNLKDGFTKGVSWSSILLCASTLALGTYLKQDRFGIIEAVSEAIPVNMILTIVFAVVLTNLISNIVTTTVTYNLIVPAMLATSIGNPVAATIAIGIGASLAYALPSSIAHIALAGSSGWATNKDMLKYGSVMIVASIITMVIFFI